MDAVSMIPAAAAKEGDVTLEHWIAMHGPISPSLALVIALDISVRASRQSDTDLASSIDSLSIESLTRSTGGAWTWNPRRIEARAHTISESDVVERLGTLLFHALSGRPPSYPLGGEQTLRNELRRARPDLPGPVTTLTVESVRARHTRLSLSALERDARRALGITHRASQRHPSRRLMMYGAAAVIVASGIALWTGLVPSRMRPPDSTLLTTLEQVTLDVSNEAAQSFAFMDEHTAAIQLYQQVARLWGTLVAAQDPRALWNVAYEAWVRTLAADRLTTEQLLENLPTSLAALLGERHPYTRAARLGLAATLEARGATQAAATLRAAADRSTYSLFEPTGAPPGDLDSRPVPPALLAHLAPNDPAGEGFRTAPGGGFFAPLMSAQRWIASRDGWRVHVVATGPCGVTLTAATEPRVVALNLSRGANGVWQAQVAGSHKALRLTGAPSDSVRVSLAGQGTDLQMTMGEQVTGGSVDPTDAPPSPPYGLAFSGDVDGRGCSLVWLEIPYPEPMTFLKR
ncbi:MAG: hypothetical protein ABL986_15910 [Vicinamibacterales bacterium]